MWRSVFLHEFLGGDVRIFNGVSGTAAPGSFDFYPPAIAPGQRFLYELDEPMDDVIGYSGRLRIRRPGSGAMESMRVMRAGSDVEFRVQQVGGMLPDLSSKVRGFLRIGANPFVDIGTLTFPYRDFVDVRFDWHTSGQARLIQDGRLVGYHNAVAPGALITIPNISLGRSDVPLGTVGPRFGVQRIFVRALRRPDALGILSRLLPVSKPSDDPRVARCRTLAMQDLLGVAETLRTFMSKFHQQESTPWTLEASPGSDPFSADSATAHQQAMKAGAALVQILRTSDFSSPNTFLEPFGQILRTLHRALPLEFESMAQEILANHEKEHFCREVLRRDREDNGAEFEPIIEIVRAASQIVLDVAGGP